ncbi:DUF2339 domain-containing protein [Psychrobacter sp. 1U2]|uniref:DUF2339 domain-containing protein n=1 Tax=Psychrobacter sp. 1U2 TaxID=3453577 RepID=UPI003F488338
MTMLGLISFIILLIIIIVLHNKLNKQLIDLRCEVTRLQAELQKQNTTADATASNTNITNPPLTNSDIESKPKSAVPPPLPSTVSSSALPISLNENKATDPPLIDHSSLNPDAFVTKASSPVEPDEQSLPIVTSLFHSLKNWFFGGNLVVRVGVIVLLIGVVLLLRLLSDYIEISIESKLIAIAAIGLGLAALGLKLAKNRFAYGITLQGAGLAIAYLTTFFAYSVYQVLPSLPSFIGLGVLSALTIGLAVRQNAFPLALLALSGGFFAPILTADDTGSLTALFSYYLLLNVTIAIIAHYRTWKVLNLFGALVTFGLAYYWGISEDLSPVIESQRWSLVTLVALHLALYLFVVIRYAQQIIAYNQLHKTDSETTAHLTSAQRLNTSKPANSLYLFPIDTGLLFSVPLLAFGLFSVLLQDIPHALTMTSAILAAIYLSLGLVFVKRSQHYALITEGMLALGFGFLALVIPLALDAQWIAFGWSVQGLALVWFGRRSLRAWSVLFGLLLQLVSIAMLMVTLFFSYKNHPTLALSVSALAFLASVFILRVNNSPTIYNSAQSKNNAQEAEQKTNIKMSDSITTYAKDLGISQSAAYQWVNSINEKSSAFSIVWRRPIFISFLTFIAVVWALYVGIADFQQWLSHKQVATTTLIALSSLLSVSVYWLISRYRPWQEIRQLSQGLLVIFYTALILQLPQKFEFGYQWHSMNWTLFAVLLIGWFIIGQLWLKTWYQQYQLSRFDSASWLATGIFVLAAAVHYGLPASQGIMAVLIPVALMLGGLYFSYRHDKSPTTNPTDSQKNLGLALWFDWQQALIDCAKVFVPITLLWVVVTNWSYDGVIWGLPYFPLMNLYDISLWLVVIYGLSTVYLSYKDPQNTSALQGKDINKKVLNPKPILIILGLVSFWVISSMLIRSLHAFIGTPLWHNTPLGAWDSEQVQTGLTILWTLIALIATIVASRQSKRTPWFMGIGLLGVVVLKLVLVDLSQTEAIWRVLSFLVAGSLILLIGYLAPLPPEVIEKDAETQ